jgi:hypothetical protein
MFSGTPYAYQCVGIEKPYQALPAKSFPKTLERNGTREFFPDIGSKLKLA